MKRNLSEKLDQLKEINEKTHDILLDTLAKFDISPPAVNSIFYISYKLLIRFSFLIKATNHFIDDLKKDSSFEMQIGLLLRPILLDILSYEYIMAEFKKNVVENQKIEFSLISDVENYLADNLVRYKTETERFYSDSYINENQSENINKFLNKISIDVFGKNIFQGSKKYSFPPASFLYNKIKESKFSKKYAPVYYLYSHYSKYEHFGLLTTIMPNDNINSFEDIVFRFIQSNAFINKFIIDVLMFLRLDSKKMKKFEEVFNEMLSDFDLK
jgi:hypothetical protein